MQGFGDTNRDWAVFQTSDTGTPSFKEPWEGSGY